VTRRALRERAADEDGFTMVELSVAMLLTVMIMTALVSVFYAFSQNAVDQGQHAELQREMRTVMSELVMDLRQAVAPSESASAYPIESLTADRIVFYTDQHESEGPERTVYERTDCLAGFCELWVTRYAAVPGTGPNWDFAETPFEESFLLGRVRSDEAMFRVADWTGDPKTKTYGSSCGGAAPRCDEPIVAVSLRAIPTGTSAAAASTFEIVEEVTLRNA